MTDAALVTRLFEAALAHQKRQEIEPALQAYRRIVELEPERSDAWNNVGILLAGQGKLGAAIACLKRATAGAAPSAIHLSNLGEFLRRARCFAEAMAALERSLALEPDRCETIHNYGLLLRDKGDTPGTVASFDRLLALAPGDASYRWERALALLASGDLEQGFAEYESRWQTKATLPRFPMPLWQGERLDGASILIHGEQGFGDMIQFARYLPMLEAQGARVVFAVPAELLRLFHGLAGNVAIIDLASDKPLTDFHLPAASLPHRFATTIDSIPAAIPYLRVPGTLSARLARPAGTRLTVALCWAGRPTHEFDHERSIPLEELLPLTDLPGVAFSSLQKGPRAGELATSGAGALIVDLSARLDDFAVTAAVLKEIDLVVSVDTALVHLAGAMGRRCFVLLPFAADWRWLRQREDSPWYPTLRLFRQDTPGDWRGVVKRLRSAIEEELRARAST
jgi:Tetratricopeptide repeat/Glycosyltransferase family 9 (heptosyltransferase)